MRKKGKGAHLPWPEGETGSVQCRTPGPDARERKSELTIEVVCFHSWQNQLRYSTVAAGGRSWVRESHAWSGVGGHLSCGDSGAGDFTRLLFGCLLAKPSRTQAEDATVVPPAGVALVYS